MGLNGKNKHYIEFLVSVLFYLLIFSQTLVESNGLSKKIIVIPGKVEEVSLSAADILCGQVFFIGQQEFTL